MTEFKVGDIVKISEDHPATPWRGLTGTITNVYSAHSVLVDTKEEGLGGFNPKFLTLFPSIILKEDAKIGMEIEATKVIGDTTHIRRGVVDRIVWDWGIAELYSKIGTRLDFGQRPEKVKVIKDAPAPDPLIEELDALNGGSVVQREDVAGPSTLTFSYIKSTRKGIWHFYNPSTRGSSVEIDEELVLTAIKDKGAQIVIRK